jgi:hypothetical protein
LQKSAVLLLLLLMQLHAAFIDDDMDGVPNDMDQCPNSALTDIVDANGCRVDKVHFKKEHHFDVTVGISYSKLDNERSESAQSLSLGYYYGNFSAYFYTSNYDLEDGESGIGDSTLAVYYRQIDGNLGFKVGAGGYIPTDDTAENETDYFLTGKIFYYRDAFDLTLDFQHTFMQDADTVDIDRLTFSLGYLISQKAYGSLSYTTQNSVYDSSERLDSTTLYLSYFFDKHWFGSTDVTFGVSDAATDFSSSMYVGYYF